MAVWLTDVEPLLRSDLKGVLEAKWVLEVLRTRYPEQFHAGQARTLQRRFRDWRARHGVEPEVFFEQVAVPGREAAIDFTHATDLGVTIAGDPFPHLLFEFVLSYSHWTWVAIAFGETFEALAASVQGALWALGGVPDVLRSDNSGDSWHEVSGNLPTDFGFPIEVHAHEPDTVYVVPITSDSLHYPPDGKLRVYRSRTGGNEWEALTNGLPQENCFVNVLRDAMAVDTLDKCGVYFGTTGGQVYCSPDGGDNWSPIVRDLPAVLSVEVQTLA